MHEPETELTAGAPAPDFRLPATLGGSPTEVGEVGLADYRGRAVILYFYPKDDTSG